MKKKQILSGILTLLMLTGCAGNTSQAVGVTTSLNQSALLEKASQEQVSFSLPERFTGDWTAQEGKVTIHADAEIAANQGVALPTATVTPREFNKEDVDNLLRVFLNGELLYGFADSVDSNEVSGFGTANEVEYVISISNGTNGAFRTASVDRKDYQYRDYAIPLPDVSMEAAIASGSALMQELGFDTMVLDDAQLLEPGLWELYYTPTVNGIPISSIRMDNYDADGDRISWQYRIYSGSEEVNPDTVSWYQENIRLVVGKDGVFSFRWDSPSGLTAIQVENSALMPFDKITSIANTMLPIVIIGPSEARSITEIDQINGFDTHFDVTITKVSLSLMRIRDKGSLQGTIVPVWDFWGTTSWTPDDVQTLGNNGSYNYDCLMTLNAIDGSVVSRLFGY